MQKWKSTQIHMVLQEVPNSHNTFGKCFENKAKGLTFPDFKILP